MISVGVIGAGHWGPNLIRNFHNGITSRVVCVVDSRPERIKAVSSRFPDVKMSGDVEAIFGDPNIQAVVIATPTATHFALCKRALEAGKHVLVEKPIASTLGDAEALVAQADAAGLTLMVGHVFLFNPAVQRVKKMIDSGDLGRVYYVSMVRTNLGPIRHDVNASWDLASHDISIVDYWLGARAQAASAVGGAYINPGVEDVVFATLKYPNSVLVNLHASWLNPRKNRDITVVGDKRMLTFDDMNVQEPIRVYDKGVTDEKTSSVVDTYATFRASVRDGDIVIPRVAMGEPLKSECDAFIDCVAQKKKPVASGLVGANVVRALEAIQRSLRNGGREETI
ncbi:MAG: Gfo/Idh/MocA family oxidoreductase [Archangium sp.]|nr:Gfo/Idh/MocA family oxidoreductase [Archangium sp.]